MDVLRNSTHVSNLSKVLANVQKDFNAKGASLQ